MTISIESEVSSLTEPQKAWLAGIIDGEGSIFIMKQKRKDRDRDINYILRVAVQSTDKYMIPKIHELVGGPLIVEQYERRENQHNTLKWQLNGKNAIKFLKAILPYLVVKPDQALEAIHFQTTFKKHWKHMNEEDYVEQEKSYFKLKSLKKDAYFDSTINQSPTRVET